MVSPFAPGVPSLEQWTAVSTFLNALSEALAARLTVFVPLGPGVPSTRSRTDESCADIDVRAVDAAARQWQSGGHGETARMSVPRAGVLDIAAVRGPTGEPRGALVVLRSPHDGTDRASAVAEVELAAALVPSVLGSSLADTASHALLDWAAAQPGGRVAFALSVDRLGATNEVLGYRAGDVVLRTLVGRVEYWVGASGRMARFGGARYLVIRTDLDSETAALSEVERLRALVAEPVSVEGVAISRSVSVGVSIDRDRSISPDVLLWDATRACAEAREAGGDSVHVYSATHARGRLDRLQLELELPSALASDALRMHYQPEFDLRTGAIVAVEALLRWQHPRRGLLSADQFVAEVEQTRTFVAVQHWVIDNSCRQLAEWLALGLASDMVLRVNVPAPQVLHGGVTKVLFAALDRHRLPGSQVCIELTERRMPDDVARLADELARWRERGITVAVDDFGTGEGTLSHLQTLPVDILKIDQRFVASMRSDYRAGSIVSGVVALARSLGLGVVAEGVDGPDIARALLALGCDRGQGNGLAAALPPVQLEQRL
ncbi:MAG: putative bifunctional diguanylate cyclase/phosphodiesterase, partial [Jatrophihabitantaceae bacterium]